MKKGYKIGDTTFKVHLDGYNLLPFLSGKEEESPRKGFLYWSDDGDSWPCASRNTRLCSQNSAPPDSTSGESH